MEVREPVSVEDSQPGTQILVMATHCFASHVLNVDWSTDVANDRLQVRIDSADDGIGFWQDAKDHIVLSRECQTDGATRVRNARSRIRGDDQTIVNARGSIDFVNC